MVYVILISAVFIGVLLAKLLNKNKKITELLLIFSGAYLLSVTLLHNFPLLYKEGNTSIWLFIILGIMLQIVLESFSKGVEHGHVHHNEKLSIPIVVGLMLHAFLEGMPIGGTHEHGNLIIAIAIHKIPVATILYFYLDTLFKDSKKVYLALLIFAFMTPLGTFISNLYFINQYPLYILALVSGAFIHISTTILFENSSSKGHQLNWQKLIILIIASSLVLLI